MVAKKPQSKRIPTARRAKIQKKVREHHKKVKKTARKEAKSGHTRKSFTSSQNIPLPKSLMERLEIEKMERLAKDAQKKCAEYQQHVQREEKEKNSFQAVENSKRSFFKEFRKVIEESDVILQVLDARDPIGTRAKHVEEMVLEAGSGKRIILVLNKIDLVPKTVVQDWIKMLRNDFPTIAFKASTQSQRCHLGQSKSKVENASTSLLQSSECLGADSLIQLLKNYCRNANIKTSIAVGVIGYPNVGKSSIINSLKRAKVCNVGNTPGITKATQQITLDKNIKLIDCPGIIFSHEDGPDRLFKNAVKVEQIENPAELIDVLLNKISADGGMLDNICAIYNIAPFADAQDFLVKIAFKLGRLRKGGIPDINAAARQILQDWNNGKIPYYTLPPKNAQPTILESTVLTQWGNEFNLSAIESVQVDEINAMQDVDFKVEQQNNVPSSVQMMEVEPASSLRQKRSKAKEVEDEPIFSAADAVHNPQINQQNKKAAKEAKKQKKRAVNNLANMFGTVGMNDKVDDSAYDFASDFVPIPSNSFGELNEENE